MNQKCFVGFAVLLALLSAVQSQCPTADPPLPAGPIKPTAQFPGLTALLASKREIVQDHWSEVAKMLRPPAYNPPAQPPRDNCPYVPSATNVLKNWHDPSTWPGNRVPAAGQPVNIPSGTKVLVSSCSVKDSDVYGTISIPEGSELIFADANIKLRTFGIDVYGALRIGSPTCRIRNKIVITLHGFRNATQSSPPPRPHAKGIWVHELGVLDLHGVRYFPTWTRLAATALPGESTILVQDVVNWQPGQSVLITTTEVRDSRDWHRNEVLTIQSVSLATAAGPNVAAITFTTPLSYLHYGGKEYQAEVGLLTRNIVIQGDEIYSEPTDNSPIACRARDSNGNLEASTFPCENHLTGYGGHVMVAGDSATGRVAGVEFYRMGQTNVLARYPIHFHKMDQNGANSYITDCSVHRSFYRCYSIHGTHNALISENVAYDAIAHCYYLEDGVEENNTFSYNLGAHVHFQGPVHQISLPIWNDFSGQTLEWIKQTENITLPADFSASPFYITNSYNTFIGNSASGGFSSYAFPSLPWPLKDHFDVPITPKDRPLKLFKGNVGHSTAYWWMSAGAVYLGGTLRHVNPDDPSSILNYTAGRSEGRITCNVEIKKLPGNNPRCPDDQRSWMRFEDTKIFLASGRGMQHWGARSDIIRLEVHDAGMSMNVFGSVYVSEMLMECRSRHSYNVTDMNGCKASGNSRCNIRDAFFFRSVNGFQWYDIHQEHIVTNSTFRNCNTNWPRCEVPGCPNCAVWTLLSHSDQFIPEMMQISKSIKYENANPDRLFRFSTNLDNRLTVSGRLQNWLDADGSAGQIFSERALMGSAFARNWWKVSQNCVEKQDLWHCPWSEDDFVASIWLSQNATAERTIGAATCRNGYFGPTERDGIDYCPEIGSVTHFGRASNDGLVLDLQARITGPLIKSSGGWAIQFNNGAPKNLTISDLQINPASSLVVAIAYPTGTTFNIYARGASFCNPRSDLCRWQFRSVNSVDEVRYGNGDTFFWDAGKNWLYVRIVQQKKTSLGTNGAWSIKPLSTLDPFSREGLYIIPYTEDQGVYIEANCPGTLRCNNPAGLTIPPALGLPTRQIPGAPTPAPSTPTTAAPTTRAPTLAPTTAAPTTSAPTTAAPTTRAPTLAPSTAAPTTSAPTTAAPTTRAPTLAPTTAAPTSSAPTTAAPTTRAPTLAPTTAAPTSSAPTTAAPTTRAPTLAPTTAAPTTSAPTTAAPTTRAPTLAPTTAAPTTSAPTTAAPTTRAPTQAPSTASPSTIAPTSAAPTTTSPTQAPSTAAPSSSAPAPTTASPTTKAPSSTETPIETTFAPTNGPASTSPPAPAEESGFLQKKGNRTALIASGAGLGGLILIGAGVVVFRRRGRRYPDGMKSDNSQGTELVSHL